ncbi:MAG TPA: hypothetical protein VLV17_01375 [Anaeromyxobacteraceae bacterium]|nr:hypothetical protein [Anaeromyxobacteraceae bacterium]
MKRTIFALAAALAACGGTSSSGTLTAEEARNAIPSSSQAQIAVPDASSVATGPQAKVSLSTVEAPFAADTVYFATAVNGSVAFTLGIVQAVVQWPPTSCSGNSCTWGPGAGPLDLNYYKLVVTKVANQDYAWSLEGDPKSDTTNTFVTFISGEAFTTGIKDVGHGTLDIDMDAANQLHYLTPPTQVGKIQAQYDNRSGANLSVQFLGTKDSDGVNLDNAAYQYTANSSGGDLQLAVENLGTTAELQLNSRWTTTGAGRGDAQVTTPAATYTESQCWDSAATIFNLLYDIQDGSVLVPQGGSSSDESVCAFIPAALPTITVPQG